jgi:hypothetical protein
MRYGGGRGTSEALYVLRNVAGNVGHFMLAALTAPSDRPMGAHGAGVQPLPELLYWDQLTVESCAAELETAAWGRLSVSGKDRHKDDKPAMRSG